MIYLSLTARYLKFSLVSWGSPGSTPFLWGVLYPLWLYMSAPSSILLHPQHFIPSSRPGSLPTTLHPTAPEPSIRATHVRRRSEVHGRELLYRIRKPLKMKHRASLLPKLVSQTFQGKSLIASVSGETPASLCLSIHSQLLTAYWPCSWHPA